MLISSLGPAWQARKFGRVRTRTRTIKVLDVALAEISEDREASVEGSAFWLASSSLGRGSFRSEVRARVQTPVTAIWTQNAAWVRQRSVDGRESQEAQVSQKSFAVVIIIIIIITTMTTIISIITITNFSTSVCIV